MVHEIAVKVWGELACFTRPEMKVETDVVSDYHAFRGSRRVGRDHVEAADDVACAADHHGLPPITRPHDVTRPFYELVSVRRNEISSRISTANAKRWMANSESFEPYLVDSAGRGNARVERIERNATRWPCAMWLTSFTLRRF